MKRIIVILAFLNSFVSYAQSKLWLIGTAHEKTNYITPDTLLKIFNKIQPDVILLELEQKHFNKEFQYDTSKYPLKDYLVNNENIASYNYQKTHGTQLRPFDLEGRHDFYVKEKYNENENTMFKDMLECYKTNQLSENCKLDFEILLFALSNYSGLKFNSLREANSDVSTKFMALKNKINFDIMLSVIKNTPALNKWQKFAELRKDYWEQRNNGMVNNILKYTDEFKDKKIVILVGNDHRYILLDKLKQKHVSVANFY